MSTTIKELLDEDDLELLIEALSRFEKHCRRIAERPIQGYGSVSEKMKKEAWRDKAYMIRELEKKISYEFI